VPPHAVRMQSFKFRPSVDHEHSHVQKNRFFCIFLKKYRKLRKKLEQHSIEVYNSRRPLDRITLTVTLTLTFDLIFIGGQGIVMNYPCAKFGYFSFSRFVLSCGQTDKQNHRGGSTLYSRDYRQRK